MSDSLLLASRNGHAPHVSPTLLASGRKAPAYEIKFVIPEPVARQVETWALERLSLDPHAHPELGNAYRTTTLYLDTDARDVFHRRGSHKRRKYRVRRYGEEAWVFLERKCKSEGRVSKQRTRVTLPEVPLVTASCAVGSPAEWFARRVGLRKLRPACLVRYDRTAFAGAVPEGALRLTIDRRLSCVLTDAWAFEFPDGLPLLEGLAILEFKFQVAMPALFKGLVHDLKLNPDPASKYRLGLNAWLARLSQGRGGDA